MQVTIITGASRGIGKAITEDLKVHLKDSVFITLSSKNVDFYNYEDVYEGTKTLLDCFHGLDQINLILCAAQIGTPKEFNLEEFDKLYRINVLGNLAVVKAASDYLIPMRVVWFAGGGAAFPYPEFPAYSASKVAVVRTVENLSLIFPDSCFVALAPGAVQTDMLKTVEEAGCEIRTRTDISEPVKWVRQFLYSSGSELNQIVMDRFMNGKFFHVRDEIITTSDKNKFTLRRCE